MGVQESWAQAKFIDLHMETGIQYGIHVHSSSCKTSLQVEATIDHNGIIAMTGHGVARRINQSQANFLVDPTRPKSDPNHLQLWQVIPNFSSVLSPVGLVKMPPIHGPRFLDTQRRWIASDLLVSIWCTFCLAYQLHPLADRGHPPRTLV